MSRDWQQDMELVKEYGNSDMPYNLTEFAKMLPYWLEQYAHEANEVCYWKGEAKTEKERADKAEEREQKLKEQINECIKDAKAIGYDGVANLLEQIISSAYPDKEEEV